MYDYEPPFQWSDQSDSHSFVQLPQKVYCMTSKNLVVTMKEKAEAVQVIVSEVANLVAAFECH